MPKEPNGESEILLYQTEDGSVRVEVQFQGDTVWLTQAQMTELFQTTKQNISLHIQNIFVEKELIRGATVKESLTVQQEGNRSVQRRVEFYNLDVIISVGYRVKSHRGTQFRIWATRQLREYITKGFVLDDERLKNPPGPGVPDYFNDLFERIRDIRASERRIYLRVREILALAADYQPDDDETHLFFQTVQNKLHFAVSGKTAPELISERADASKSNMGLTAWRGAVVRKGDVAIAKNYLNEEEITQLNLIVTMFLDYAEDQARRRKQVFMRDWRLKLDDFLKFNERGVLTDAGAVSREEADRHAQNQYTLFEERRRKELEARSEAEFATGMTGLEQQLKQITPSLTRKGKKP